MDLLYSRYASPMEFMCMYIEQGRFGEFVANILELEYKRKKADAEKENDQMLWEMFIHSMYEGTFQEWKKERVKSSANKRSKDEDLTDSDIEAIINKTFKK